MNYWIQSEIDKIWIYFLYATEINFNALTGSQVLGECIIICTFQADWIPWSGSLFCCQKNGFIQEPLQREIISKESPDTAHISLNLATRKVVLNGTTWSSLILQANCMPLFNYWTMTFTLLTYPWDPCMWLKKYCD